MPGPLRRPTLTNRNLVNVRTVNLNELSKQVRNFPLGNMSPLPYEKTRNFPYVENININNDTENRIRMLIQKYKTDNTSLLDSNEFNKIIEFLETFSEMLKYDLVNDELMAEFDAIAKRMPYIDFYNSKLQNIIQMMYSDMEEYVKLSHNSKKTRKTRKNRRGQ